MANDAQPAAAPRGMDPAKKPCLLCGCLLLLIAGTCLLTSGFLYSRAQSREYAEHVVQEVLACEVPPGLEGRFGWDTGGRMAVVAPPGTPPLLDLQPTDVEFLIAAITVPPGHDPDLTVAGFVEQYAENPLYRLEVAEEAEVTVSVRGEDVAARDLRGTIAGSIPCRAVAVAVPRDADDPAGEKALLLFVGAGGAFDEEAMAAFLGSIE